MNAPSPAIAELGPAVPPRGELRAIANEAYQLVLILQHAVIAGDHLRATRTIGKLRVLIGPGGEEEKHG